MADLQVHSCQSINRLVYRIVCLGYNVVIYGCFKKGCWTKVHMMILKRILSIIQLYYSIIIQLFNSITIIQ